MSEQFLRGFFVDLHFEAIKNKRDSHSIVKFIY